MAHWDSFTGGERPGVKGTLQSHTLNHQKHLPENPFVGLSPSRWGTKKEEKKAHALPPEESGSLGLRYPTPQLFRPLTSDSLLPTVTAHGARFAVRDRET